MTLTPGGWAFLVTSWMLIIAGTAWCLWQVLYAAERRRRRPGDGK